MPLNTSLLLSPLSLSMEQMAELLRAEQPELDLVIAHARKTILECSIETCEDTISRYEKIFGLPSSGKSLEERREAVLFTLNARLLVTKEYLAMLVGEVLGCFVWVEEFFSEYRFRMNVEGENRTPDMAEAARKVRVLKPAHIDVTLRYRQVERGTVPVAARGKIGLWVKVLPYQPPQIHEDGSVPNILYIKAVQRLNIRVKE